MPEPERACMQVLSFVHVLLCCILPSVPVYLAEARSREAFQAAKRRRRSSLGSGLLTFEAAVIPSLLASLMGMLVWEVLEFLYG